VTIRRKKNTLLSDSLMQNGFVCRGEGEAVIDLLGGSWKEVNPCYTKQQSECVRGYSVYPLGSNLLLTATKPEKNENT
jgi:hypothetical protein